MDADGPNLLFILSDQHAQKIAGCYGDPLVETPHLDRLAASGVTFENAYTPSPVCVPARMSLLTGRHPHNHRCWGNNAMLASDIATTAHSLGAGGVAPIIVGRMDAKGPDQLHGHVRRESGEHSSNWWGRPTSLGALDRTNGPCRESIVLSGPGDSSYILKDEHTVTETCRVLEEIAAKRKAGDAGRFALTVGLILPHHPFVARKDDYRRYAGRVSLPRLAPPKDQHAFHAWWREQTGSDIIEEASWLRARTAYYALVTAMDRMIGQVLDTLAATGLDRDTLVIYASDHGEQLGERGLWWKHTFYDDSVKVPLVMSWPGVLPAGGRRRHVVNLVDLAATMLDAMGTPPLPSADGRSFLGIAKSEDAPWSDETFSEFVADGLDPWMGGAIVQQRMIRSGRWKLVCYHGSHAGPPQLFDLDEDPDELHDRAGDPACSDIAGRLRERLRAGWNPEEIRQTTDGMTGDLDLIRRWARSCDPPEAYYWPTRPGDNRLDPPQPAPRAQGDQKP